MKNILLAVTGGIAAYKAIDLTSKLTQANYDVRVMLTDHAQEFVTPLAFQAISRNLSLIHISEPTRRLSRSRMPSSA